MPIPSEPVFCHPFPCATPVCRIDPLSPAKTQRGLAKPKSKAGEGAQASQHLHCEYYCLLSCGSPTLLKAHCVWRSDPDPTRVGSGGRQAPRSKFPVSELCNCVQVSPLTSEEAVEISHNYCQRWRKLKIKINYDLGTFNASAGSSPHLCLLSQGRKLTTVPRGEICELI